MSFAFGFKNFGVGLKADEFKPKKPKKEQRKNAHLYSRFATAAYHDGKDRQQVLKDGGVRGYKYQKRLSSDEIAVFKKGDQLIVSARGTTLGKGVKTAFKDLTTDLLVATGATPHGDRFKALDDQVAKLVGIHGKDNVILTGHSLGGTLAQGVAEKHGLEAHVFNPGKSPVDHGSGLAGIARALEESKVFNYHVENDPVSLAGRHGKNTFVFKQSADNAHTVDNFHEPKMQKKRPQTHQDGSRRVKRRVERSRMVTAIK